jgi:hypothetical protein
MSLIREDRVAETSVTTGTGAITLAGAIAGYRAFGSVCAVGDTCYYALEAISAAGVPTGDWECGIGTYSGTNTLTRTTILDSSNSNAVVNLAAGTKRVYVAMSKAALNAVIASYLGSYRGTYSTANAGYSWNFEDGVVPGVFTQTDALTVISDTDAGVTQNSITFNGGNPITSNFSTYQFSFSIVADASHTTLTIRAKIQCNYTGGGAWEGVKFFVDGVDQGQLAQSVSAETTYTDHVITGLAAGTRTITVQFHTSAYSDVGFQNVRIASITNGVATTTPYHYGDVVDYSGARYMCLVPGTTALPSVTTDWAPVNSAVLTTSQVSARYWGLFDIEPQPDQQLVIAEVGFRLAAGGAAAAVSATDGSNAGTPGNVVPGVAGNWDTYVSTSGYRAPHWVGFDFGAGLAPVEFYIDSRSDFAGGAAQAPRTVQLAYSSDGITWTPHSRYTMAFTALGQRIALPIAGVASFGAISPTAISPTYTLRGATDYDNTTAPSANQVIAWNNGLGKYKPATLTMSYHSDVDVTTTAPTNGQALIYDSTSGKWKPGSVATGSSSVASISMASGRIVGGNPPTLGGVVNVASVARTAAGRYRVTFTTPMSSANYAILLDGKWGADVNSDAPIVSVDRLTGYGKTTTYVDIMCMSRADGNCYDPGEVWFVVYDPALGLGGGAALATDCLAYAYSNATVAHASNVTSTGAAIDSMTCTFRLAAPAQVEVAWSMLLLRSSGAIRILPIVDGTLATRPDANANFYSLGQGENSIQQANGKLVISLAAGTHTIVLNYADALSATTFTAYQREMTVRQLVSAVASQPAVPVIAPPSTLSTWVNQGTSTVTTNSDGTMTLVSATDTSENIRGVFMSLPATPWSYRIGFMADFSPVNYQNCGIALRESSSGKMVVFCAYRDAGGAGNSGPLWYIANYNSVTSKNANVLIPAREYGNGPFFLKIADDGTTRTAAFGFSRFAQKLAPYSVAHSSFIVPDQIGIITNNFNATIPLALSLLSWE